MKPSYIVILAALAALVAGLFSGCSDKTNKQDISFERIAVEKSYRFAGSADECGTRNDLSYGCQVDILMPSDLCGIDCHDLQDTIMQRAFGFFGGNRMSAINDALRNIAAEVGYMPVDTVMPDSVIASSPHFLSRYDGYTCIQGEIETLTSRLMSYAITNSTYYPGAAHGMYGTMYINYDLTHGRIIRLSDIFTEEGLEILPAEISKKAAQMVAVIGDTDIDSLPADNNFYLTASGDIVFAYQPYEVASYAQGEIQIPLAAYLLSQYLTEEGAEMLLWE